jgi:hypothetical protein
MKPGKKGVSLTSEQVCFTSSFHCTTAYENQWAAMAGKVDVINDMIKAKA